MKTFARATLAAAASLAAAAASVQAADVQIYGRVDAGLRYTHTDAEDTFELRSGQRSHNRIGLNIVEDLGDGLKVKGYLENGFTLDDGALDDEGQLFNRRSVLALQGHWGELGMGRMGTVQSTASPYTMGLIKYDPFGTSYGQASIGTTFANTSRVNNAVTWISPKFAGWKVGATYSFGDKKDSEEWADYQDRDHTLALAADYTGENLYLSFTFGSVAWGNVGQADAAKAPSVEKDAEIYGFGGWWRFMPESKLFWGAQYSKHWSAGAGLSAANAVKYAGDAAKTGDAANGWDGYALLLGADYTVGQHKAIAGVQFYDGELSNNSDIDYQFTVLAAAYEYKLAKQVWLYAAATTSFGSGKASNGSDYNEEATELMAGLNINF